MLQKMLLEKRYYLRAVGSLSEATQTYIFAPDMIK